MVMKNNTHLRYIRLYTFKVLLLRFKKKCTTLGEDKYFRNEQIMAVQVVLELVRTTAEA